PEGDGAKGLAPWCGVHLEPIDRAGVAERRVPWGNRAGGPEAGRSLPEETLIRTLSGCLADGPFQAELGPIIGDDRVEVIEAGLGERLDGLQDLDGTGGVRQLGPLADVEGVELERVDRLDQRLARVLDLAVRRLADVIRRGDIGDDLGLRPDLLEAGG